LNFIVHFILSRNIVLYGFSLRRWRRDIVKFLVFTLFCHLLFDQESVFESSKHGENLFGTNPSENQEPDDTCNNNSNVGCIVKISIGIVDKHIFGNLLFSVEEPVMLRVTLDGLDIDFSDNAYKQVLEVWILFGEFRFLYLIN
jgi:hypothetical protein